MAKCIRITLALGALVALAIGETAVAQYVRPGAPVPPAQAIDYSPSTPGAAAASDMDPSWITVAPGVSSPWNAPRRTPAQFAVTKNQGSDNVPPPMPPSPGVSPDYSNGNGAMSGKAEATDGGSTACPSCSGSQESCPSCNSNSSSCGCSSGCDSCDSCNHCCCPRLHPLFTCHECCPLVCEDQTVSHIFDCCCLKEHDTTITGWVDAGYEGNFQAPQHHYNGIDTFPDRDDGQFNQLYVAMERTAPAKNCGTFIGGRVDLLYGSDYFFTTAAGLDGSPVGNVPRWGQNNFQYGLAMPQLYAETDWDDLKVKWGHFYTIIGYEVVPSTGNFFYSHSFTMQYGEPFTHTGILASKPWCEYWTWYAGIVSGWNEFDMTGGPQFLGGITYTDKDYGSLAFGIVTGDDSTANLPGVKPNDNRTMYSIVWTRNLSSRWTYVLQHDLGVQQNAMTAEGIRDATWYGLNQYLFYKINCCWTAGIRAEWFHDQNGFVVTGLRPGNPVAGDFFPDGDFYEITLGLNWKPNANVEIRPEVRWDWHHGPRAGNGDLPFGDANRNDQALMGLDAIVQF
jgi:hypothetical protein